MQLWYLVQKDNILSIMFSVSYIDRVTFLECNITCEQQFFNYKIYIVFVYLYFSVTISQVMTCN